MAIFRTLRLLPILIVLSCNTVDENTENSKLPEGMLRVSLNIDDGIALPFLLEFPSSENEKTIYINNQLEQYPISAEMQKWSGDTLVLETPLYLTELWLWPNKDGWEGEWRNISRSIDYKIPLVAVLSDNRFEGEVDEPMDVSGEWKMVFGEGDESSYGLGKFSQEGSKIIGNIQTETGDYRFLEGFANFKNSKIATFDIAHAFLFDIEKIEEDSLIGVFYSGNHWTENFYMVRDSEFVLADPDSLTTLKEGYDGVEFSFPDLEGVQHSFPSDEWNGKALIVQIMGSWCPNCMDESVHFKKLYEYYHEEGLEIVAVTFERSADLEQAKPHIEKMIADLNLSYTVLFGGRASTRNASEQFPALNHVMSFPTSIFIDRLGNVRRIHTGFNGPGSGVAFDEFVKETDVLIRQMLLE